MGKLKPLRMLKLIMENHKYKMKKGGKKVNLLLNWLQSQEQAVCIV